MGIEQNVWGFSPEGEAVILYTLTNRQGASVQLTNLGASIVSIVVPDRDGNMADVALGYENPLSYFNDGPAMGKTVGRFANRISNGMFTLDGVEYRLPLGAGPYTLHGGPQNFASKLWESRVEGDCVVFSLVSPDGDMGFPSELGTEAVYSWSEDSVLTITLYAASNGPTVVNLTNHTYFNMAGHASGSVLGNTVKVNASNFLATDNNQLPTGEFTPVDGTPMDFRTAKPLGRDIDADFEPLKTGAGYDHCWVLDRYEDGKLKPAAVLADPLSGRTLEILTTQPSVQVYTGNWLQGSPAAKGGGHYANRDGVAIEAQAMPDSPNRPEFPSTVLRPGETYEQKIIFKFTAG